MKAAIKAFNEDKFQSKSACAHVVDVPSRPLRKRLNESPLATNLWQMAENHQTLKKILYLDGF